MRLIYFFLKIIFCSSEFETRQHYCIIVTDRELKGLKLKESLNTIILPLTDDNISFKSDYSWDLYLPKPIFYKIKYISSKKSTSKKSFDLVGITSDEKVMFQFKLSFNVDRMILSDFYDSNNIPIINALFHSDEVSTNIFMLSSEYKNVESIKSSFTYITLVDKIEPMYYEIFNSLFQYIKNINNLSEDFDFFCDISAFERLCKAKNSLISTTITILRNLSSLRFPIFCKLNEIPGNIRFKILLNDLFGSLEDVVEIYLRNKNGDINEEIVVQKKRYT